MSVILTNLTTQQPIATRAEVATRLFQRFAGLLVYLRFEADQALIFPRANSIHTIGMRFPIDVLFVQRGRIVRCVPQVRPCRLAGCRQADTTIELPAGTIARQGLAVGHQLAW